MDQKTVKLLKQALNILRSGDAKKARALLIDVLKTDPDNDQAWYMLSFAVPNQERQIYALNQVLRINPLHEKAMTRLEKISGETEIITEPSLEEEPDITAEPFSSIPQKQQDDLLAQRLFVPSDEVEEEHDTPVETPILVDERDSESDIKHKPRIRKKKKVKKPRKQIILPLLAKIPRRTQLLIILVLIVSTTSFLIFRGNTSTDQPIEGGDLSQTATPKAEVTPTERGGGLPPTWTPVVSSDGDQPYFGEDSPFTLTSVSLPASEVIDEMSLIQSQVMFQRYDEVAEISSFLIPKADFLQLLLDFSSFPGYYEFVNQQELVYRALGLAKSWDDLSDFPPNIWADPNGGLYLPDVESIFLQADGFEIIERYLYAREYAQVLLNSKYSFDNLGIYPFCLEEIQRCESILAVIKGDAILQANQWLNTFNLQSQARVVDELESRYYNLPARSSLPFIEEELEFPYSYGEEFIKSLYNSGGWDTVDSAYSRNLSTEQILHPDKYLKGEDAVEINDVLLSEELDSSWTEVINESIGEWMTYLLLANCVEATMKIPTDTAQEAAAGWGGDQTQIYYNNLTDQFVVGIHWVWDTNNDADQFYNTLVDYIPLRFIGAEPFDHQKAECWKSSSESICVISRVDETIWVIAPDINIMDSIIGLYIP